MSLIPRNASGRSVRTDVVQSPTDSSRRQASRPAARARRLAVSLLAGSALLVGCASTSSSGSASGVSSARDAELEQPSMMIALQDYVGKRRFELVNPAHTDPVEYYSNKRSGAGRKIVATEIVAALVEYMDENGLGQFADDGNLPFSGSGMTRGLEVRGPGGTLHWVVNSGSTAAERKAMVECTQTFLETYNLVTAYQTIDNDNGSSFFENAAAEARATGGR